MTTTTRSRIYRVWSERILMDDVWEHGKIRQWCKAVHNLAVNGEKDGFRTNLTEDEAELLKTQFEVKYPGLFDGPLVTEAQAEIGRNWLATKGVRFGLRRDVDWRSITHFRFVGGETIDHGTQWRAPYVTPRYAGFLPNGDVIRYWATPWQDHSDFLFELHEEAAA